MSSAGTWAGKEHHIGAMSPLPPSKVKSIASFGTKVEIYDAQFFNFEPTTALGMRQRIFELVASASDLIPVHEFYDTTFTNVHSDAVGYFFEPPQSWAVIADCGEWPCTGPHNTLYSFKRSTFVGKQPLYAAQDFQIIPNTPAFSRHVDNCAF